MAKPKGLLVLALAVLIAAGGGLWYANQVRQATDSGPVVERTSIDEQGRPLKEWTITAKAVQWEIAPGVKTEVWTYGGSVPGTAIQVTEGDHVRVKLVNRLSAPVSIHWHGYPVPAAMDGVPGISQDPIAPGQSFTYDFVAKVPGTYWYHSHVDSSNQVDRGLYGAFIVLPKQETEKVDREYTLLLDEWSAMTGGQGMSGSMPMDHGNMPMDHGGMRHDNMPMDHDQMMKIMYNIYTVNGRSGSQIAPLNVNPGERVRLRFINAGYMTHLVHLQGQPFRVTATDGRPVNPAPEVTDRVLAIGAGERYDVVFTAGSHSFAIDLHDGTPASRSVVIPVRVTGDGSSGSPAPDGKAVPVLDLATYPKGSGVQDAGTWDASYVWHLNSTFVNGEQVYTINGKTWPNTDPIPVKTGERVKVTLINDGTSDHPMHLHGHVFRVLSRNGVPLQGTDLEKDTLLVRPGETYEIGFVADNPGVWMFHCHDLHHAAAGMMSDVEYQDYHGQYPVDKSKAGE